jgi:hypothetical protein
MSCLAVSNAQIINISMQNKPSMHNEGALEGVYAQYYCIFVHILKTMHAVCAYQIVFAQKKRYFMHNKQVKRNIERFPKELRCPLDFSSLKKYRAKIAKIEWPFGADSGENMKFVTLLFAVMLYASAASATNLLNAFVDLHKQGLETLLELHEKVLNDHQRILLGKELQTRERYMTYEQKERYHRHHSDNRAMGKGHGREHAPGQQKKHH